MGSREEKDDTRRGRGRELVAAGERFVVIPFQSAVRAVDVVQANIVVHSFRTELHWSSHHICNSTFFRESEMRTNYVSEYKNG